jgi:hypothetical protein
MEKDNVYYPNHDDYKENFWNNNYRVSVTAQGIEFMVNADNEQEALDYVIDYCEEHLPGLIMSRDDEESEEYLDDYVSGGNHGRFLNTFNIHIESI